MRSNKRIIWDHFTDSAMLIGLGIVLDFSIIGASRLSHEVAEVVQSVLPFSKWFTIAVFVQFCIDSLVQLTIRNYADLRRGGGG